MVVTGQGDALPVYLQPFSKLARGGNYLASTLFKLFLFRRLKPLTYLRKNVFCNFVFFTISFLCSSCDEIDPN